MSGCVEIYIKEAGCVHSAVSQCHKIAGRCENDTESLNFVKCRKFPDQLRKFRFVKKDSPSYSLAWTHGSKVLCSANTKLEFSANEQSFRYLPVARKRSVTFTLSSTEPVFLVCVFCLPRLGKLSQFSQIPLVTCLENV
jgi:hypothetical protein